MTTKKTTKDGVGKTKKTTKKQTVNNPTSTTAENYNTEYADNANNVLGEMSITKSNPADDRDPFEFFWSDDKNDMKRKLAQDILIRLIDFNLEQLSRQDVDKVLIYDNPAEYAASVVNELYERIKR